MQNSSLESRVFNEKTSRGDTEQPLRIRTDAKVLLDIYDIKTVVVKPLFKIYHEKNIILLKVTF